MNPFREIWFNTGNCLNYFLLVENQKQYVYEFIWIAAISNGISAFINSQRFMGLEDPIRIDVMLLIVVTMTSVWFLRFVQPWLLQKIGILMNAKGSIRDLRLVISLSCVPHAIFLLYIFIALLLPDVHLSKNKAVDVIVWIFTMRILVLGVAKVQKLSYGVAFLNIFIPYFVLIFIYLIFR